MKRDDKDVVYSTEKDIKDFDPFLTAGDLKEKLKDVPNDTPIRYQRIEDFYFTTNGWKTKSIRWEEDEFCAYIRAFSAYYYDGDFVINAHY